MKTTSKTFLSTLLLFSLFCEISQAANYTLSGSMDVSQAITNGGLGAGEGNGAGTIAGSYNDVTNALAYTLTWENLLGDVTNMHFHNGAIGVGGGVDLGIPEPWTSPYTSPIDLQIDEAQEANLLAGDWYVNVHTANYGGGEIRGQVNVNLVPEPSAVAMTALAFFLLLPLRRKRLIVVCHDSSCR